MLNGIIVYRYTYYKRTHFLVFVSDVNVTFLYNAFEKFNIDFTLYLSVIKQGICYYIYAADFQQALKHIFSKSSIYVKLRFLVLLFLLSVCSKLAAHVP